MDRKVRCIQTAAFCARAILCLCCFISLVVCFTAGMVRYSLFDRAFFQQHIADDAYCQQITAFICQDIQDDCYVYQLPFSVVADRFDQEQITRQCRRYMDAFYDALYTGEDTVEVPYPDERLYGAVYGYLLEQGYLPMQAADDAAYISSELAARASENICALTGQRFISLLSDRIFSAPLLQRLAQRFWPLVGLTSLFVGLLLVFGARRLPMRLYVTGGVLFTAASVLFVPIWLLRLYDLPSHLILAASPMKSLFDSFWYSLTDRIFYIALTALLLSVVLLVGVIVYILWRKRQVQR